MWRRVAGKYWRIYPGNEGSMFLQNVEVPYLTNYTASHPPSTLIITSVIISTAYSHPREDPKITGIIFLIWFIRFYTITTLVSFKVLSFWLDTLVPTSFPLLKTFLELFRADVVQDLQRFLFHFGDISKTFPFHLAFHTREQEKVAWRKVGWIWRMRDNCHVVFCQKLLHTQGRVGRGIVMVKDPITVDQHFWLFFPYTIA